MMTFINISWIYTIFVTYIYIYIYIYIYTYKVYLTYIFSELMSYIRYIYIIISIFYIILFDFDFFLIKNSFNKIFKSF